MPLTVKEHYPGLQVLGRGRFGRRARSDARSKGSPVAAAPPFTPAQLTPLAWYDAHLGAVDGYYQGPDYVYLPGLTGTYVATPDANALDITGDLEIQGKVKLDDYTPAAQLPLCGKWGVGGQNSYGLVLRTNGTLRAFRSFTGSGADQIFDSTVGVQTAVADGIAVWFKVTIDVDNGASGSTAQFFTSSDGTTWTQLGADVTQSATTATFSGTTEFSVGKIISGEVANLDGAVYRVIVKSGIAGTTVADFDASQVPASGTYTDTPGRIWTVKRAATNGNLWLRDLAKTTVKYADAATLGSTAAADSNDPRWLPVDTSSYVYLPGSTNNYLSTPDTAALDFTTALEVVARINSDDWNSSVAQCIAAKWTSGTQQSWAWNIDPAGLKFYISGNGSEVISLASTVVVPFVDGSTGWVKVTWRASDNRVQFFIAADQAAEPSSWTQLGADGGMTPPTGGSLFNSTAPLSLGLHSAGTTSPLFGRAYRVIVRSTIDGTIVADFDASKFAAESSTTYTDAVGTNGGVWTLNTSTSGRKAEIVRYRGRLLLGTDDYVILPLAASPPMLALSDFTFVAVVRQRVTPGAFGDYINNKEADSGVAKGARIQPNNTAMTSEVVIGDGTNVGFVVGPSLTNGRLSVLTLVVSSAGQLLNVYVDNAAGTAASLASVGNRTSINALTVGRCAGAVAAFQDMVFFGALTFTRALSAAEIAQIVAYYGGGT